MAAIIIPRRSITQPSGVVLPATSTLQNGLVALSSNTDFAAGAGALTGAPDIVSTQYGVGFRSGAGKYLSGPTLYAPGDNQPFSLAMAFVLKTVPTGQVGFFSMGPSALGGSIRLLFVANATQIRFYWWGSYRISMTVPMVADQLYVIVFSHDGANGSAWVNGVSNGTPVAVRTDGGVAAPSYFVGAGYPAEIDAVHLCHAQWSRALSQSEALEISFNQWALFYAAQSHFYSLPSGPITINSLTASNITSSGARFTVGLTR